MHILRWLMKHPILLAWLLAVLAILLNFGMGGAGDKAGKGDHAKDTHSAPAHPVDAGKQAVSAHGKDAAPVAGQAVAAPAVVVAEQVPAVAATPAEQAPAVAAPAVAPVAEQAGAVPAPVAADVNAAPAASEQDLLRAAREAYWSNELERAAEFYGKLLEQKPDSLDYKGELANVFWKQGNANKAAELFADIAPQLAAQGRTGEAFNMKLYVDMVNPELAKKIDAALK
ncbi:MAG: hypothetical protein JG718_11825 [Candidatus Thiothrix moscowensis]|nr:hypothetical protein [Candidatus Thiothrix moscowensis]